METSLATVAVETDAAPEPVIEYPAEASPPAASIDEPAPAPEPLAPINTPVFASPFPPIEPPTLVLTPPGPAETAPPERVAWPEAVRGGEVDQNPLFETEAVPAPSLDLSVRYDPEAQPPRRFDWSETGTFLIMGGIGLVSFGAAMAAFRRAGETGGDTALIGWVLAVIALACVGVSGFNLYQRWGRADRD